MFDGVQNPLPAVQRLRFEQRTRFVVFASVSLDSEVFMILDPLTDKAEATALGTRLTAWLKGQADRFWL